MNSNLVKRLIVAGGIRAGSTLDIPQKPADIQLQFSILKASEKDNAVMFEVVDQYGRRSRINCEQVTMIDGMFPDRLGALYALRENGDPLPMGKRRGRKPKVAREATVIDNGWADFDD